MIRSYRLAGMRACWPGTYQASFVPQVSACPSGVRRFLPGSSQERAAPASWADNRRLPVIGNRQGRCRTAAVFVLSRLVPLAQQQERNRSRDLAAARSRRSCPACLIKKSDRFVLNCSGFFLRSERPTKGRTTAKSLTPAGPDWRLPISGAARNRLSASSLVPTERILGMPRLVSAILVSVAPGACAGAAQSPAAPASHDPAAVQAGAFTVDIARGRLKVIRPVQFDPGTAALVTGGADLAERQLGPSGRRMLDHLSSQATA